MTEGNPPKSIIITKPAALACKAEVDHRTATLTFYPHATGSLTAFDNAMRFSMICTSPPRFAYVPFVTGNNDDNELMSKYQ